MAQPGWRNRDGIGAATPTADGTLRVHAAGCDTHHLAEERPHHERPTRGHDGARVLVSDRRGIKVAN